MARQPLSHRVGRSITSVLTTRSHSQVFKLLTRIHRVLFTERNGMSPFSVIALSSIEVNSDVVRS
jgi:hypothetical protein